MALSRSELDSILPLTEARSGSVGLFTAGRNAHGSFIRARVSPAQPGTLTQLRARERWQQTTQWWADQLNSAERATWELYARNVPVPGRDGRPRALSGFHHFVRTNFIRRLAAIPLYSQAPTVFNLGPTVPFKIKVYASTTRSTVTAAPYENNDYPGGVGSLIIAYATPEYSPAVHSFQPPLKYRGKKSPLAPLPWTWGLDYAATVGSHVFAGIRTQMPDGRTTSINRRLVVVV